MTRWARLALLAAALVFVPGCGRDAAANGWVAEALSAHRKADLKLERGDLEGARALLLASAEHAAPSRTNPVDARILRQDLYYRVAEIDLRQDHPAQAAKWASRGIELGRGRDVFTANLLIARGHALEKTNDLGGASRDYHEALLLTESLLNDHLDGARKPQ